jgi:hypothetical protein
MICTYAVYGVKSPAGLEVVEPDGVDVPKVGKVVSMGVGMHNYHANDAPLGGRYNMT